ncbi:helix-hairpin-helix domain-containing protein [Thiolapillus brandeum]|uniref:Mitomycin resistance protein McrB n=1 Tax=Thiolapillus brandeum TaxID=1076588 RepID=A0A7U6JJP9_9GAMM|nr:helix-hairpin-helix domain-containing protein [Thiolapillus brandeum]BAO45727.1 mitomycin resistance protein McrB [Thiolapillus brandeum]
MKKNIPDNPAAAENLQQLPGIGPAMTADLQLLGIHHPRQLTGQDAYSLYEQLCQATGSRHDPCVIDVFLAAIHFMEHGEARPWWKFTTERKQALAQPSESVRRTH